MAGLKWVSGIIVAIVAIIIAVTIVGSTASVVDDAAEDITQDSRCGAAGCFWNESRGVGDTLGDYDCSANNVSNDNNSCATVLTQGAYPLEGLFNTGGIVILMFLGAAIVLLSSLAWIKLKK